MRAILDLGGFTRMVDLPEKKPPQVLDIPVIAPPRAYRKSDPVDWEYTGMHKIRFQLSDVVKPHRSEPIAYYYADLSSLCT